MPVAAVVVAVLKPTESLAGRTRCEQFNIPEPLAICTNQLPSGIAQEIALCRDGRRRVVIIDVYGILPAVVRSCDGEAKSPKPDAYTAKSRTEFYGDPTIWSRWLT